MMCLSLGPTRCRPCDETYSGGSQKTLVEKQGKETRAGGGRLAKGVVKQATCCGTCKELWETEEDVLLHLRGKGEEALIQRRASTVG